ncbi:class I mannose-6-phosphate isomerase [Paenibacillus nasutitermitis]|uniref:Mannose-6-phosphate isomerase n=1 Tax=Paenibacillus nasutitermitis TaxID=1652958 RepID=A0A916Z9P8_9BACL|nr:class I mannose-6-phosphate isomerase [Paenibacillus nasutitermitis]GGD83112.1 mannose-6-phosphate isomerase [Paenibacillus nasutitermitis]
MPSYEKEPFIPISGRDSEVWQGYSAIVRQLEGVIKPQGKTVIVIECYPAVRINEILNGLQALKPVRIIRSEDAALDSQQLEAKLSRYLTDDRVFGYMAPFTIDEWYDAGKLAALTKEMQEIREGVVIAIGFGASLLGAGDLLIYADLARWEIQQRYRSREFGNWQADNSNEEILKKYKRGFFVEWRTADRLKRGLLPQVHYYLDTNRKDDPAMLTKNALLAGLGQAVNRPFRLVPYFDPGVWGGHWLEEKIGLEPKDHPYAWGFDGVPEENSLYLQYGGTRVEIPSINLVFFEPKALLGEGVFARFGAEFPIRFDFLDTMGGQPLSLQVHPLTDYIKDRFGMSYTQDESYYILDADDDAVVYLGCKEEADPEAMMRDLERAQEGEISFPADRYVNIFPARKHDHFSIPAGTVHCSGSNAMVLEISATPYIFTFKLWDWDRLGLDGKPRPVHLQHGRRNIEWDRRTDWVTRNLINQAEQIAGGDGWTEERTGLHGLQFIETRRHWFTSKVDHYTNGGVQVLNLVEGEEAVVESPTGAFPPFTVHYAETFIIPAAVGHYSIRPSDRSQGKPLATIKAYVRT